MILVFADAILSNKYELSRVSGTDGLTHNITAMSEIKKPKNNFSGFNFIFYS